MCLKIRLYSQKQSYSSFLNETKNKLFVADVNKSSENVVESNKEMCHKRLVATTTEKIICK